MSLYLLKPEQAAYPVLRFGNLSAANSSIAAFRPISATLLRHPRTGDRIWLVGEVFSGESNARGRTDRIPGTEAAQRSGPGNTGSWTETRARLRARRNCDGTSSPAVCSAGGGYPCCLTELP